MSLLKHKSKHIRCEKCSCMVSSFREKCWNCGAKMEPEHKKEQK